MCLSLRAFFYRTFPFLRNFDLQQAYYIIFPSVIQYFALCRLSCIINVVGHLPDNFQKGVFSKSVNGFIIVLTESVNGGLIMNERFFALPKEKQQAIINAGYRVFS